TLYMPPRVRPALWALYAFNYEIARTREVVTDTTLGLIRLQWWRDAVGGIFEGGAPEGNPVLAELAQAVAAHGLPREPFNNLVYAREFDLEDLQPAHMEGLLNYAAYTSAPLMELGLRCAGSVGGEEGSDAAT